MASLITPIFSLATLLAHFLFVFCIFAFIYRKSWGHPLIKFVHKYALWLGFGVSMVAIVGSLLYSNLIGFEPCTLCWWQRIFIYPQAVLFLVAIMKKDRGIFDYALPMSIAAFIFSLYQSYSNFSGASLLPCTATGGECSRIYVIEYGYITIPLMSLTLVTYLLFIKLCAYKHENNSNA